jgi:PAS domain S-box-containing protein
VQTAATAAAESIPAEPQRATADSEQSNDFRPLLNRLPVGVLIHRHGQYLYANKSFLDWTGRETLSDFEQAGGLDSLFLEGGKHEDDSTQIGQSLTIETPNGDKRPTQARLFTIPWEGMTAMALVLMPAEAVPAPAIAPHDDSTERELRELRSILDTATDGILVVDSGGRVLTASHGAQALFGYDSETFKALPFADLFATESKGTALDYLHRLSGDAMSRLLNEGREVTGRAHQGGHIPLFMTMGRIADSADRFCAVLRDVTQWKKTEEELRSAKREAERTSSAKSEFLAKISHEIRTPLNAIIGFSEVMMNERFGTIGNERYRDYLKDIHASGGHLISLLNDLLDLSKIEAGKLDLTFADVNLNDLTQQSVAIMQPEANRERIIIRTSLPDILPQVSADPRSVRQIILNLLSNSIKFTGAGGQVIVSTAVNDNGDVVLRVRDTGHGMSESDIAIAMEPFRQLPTATRAQTQGTGLGLPLTKALAEANRARFSIKSAENSGTLVEIAFAPARRHG